MAISKGRKPRQIRISFLPLLKLVLLLLLATICLLLLNLVTISQFFPIKTVRIYGVNQVDKDETKNLIQPLLRNGFFNVDIEQIRDRMRQLAWVSDITVRRAWPDQVYITIIEKKPIARWDATTLMSDAGELFSPPKAQVFKLPQMTGPIGKQIIMLNNFNEMNRLLEPLHAKIGMLELTPYLTWKLQLDNGINLQMGHTEVLTRLAHFVKVYPKIIGNRAADIDYVDLRYPNGVAVRWKGTQT